MIHDLLKKLDFSEKEIEVYLAILRNEKITPADLSKITKINRSTVYSVVGELVEKGIVSHDLTSPVKYLVALPIEDLENIVKKEEIELARKKDVVSSAISELKHITSNKKYSAPKIRFIAEGDIESFMINQSPVWDESMLEADAVWWGFQDHTYVENYANYIDWYWSRADEGIKLKLITNKSTIEKVMEEKKYPRRKIKYFKKKVPFTATTWILGEYIVMIVTNERPFYAIEIHNAELAKNQRELFKFLWGVV
jgi:sugar-specific transcriptional regulator TrmB